MNLLRKGFFVLLFFTVAFFPLTAEEMSEDSIVENENDAIDYFFNASNWTEFVVNGGLENITTVDVGLQKEVFKGLTLGGKITSFTYLLEDRSSSFETGDTAHFNSCYLAEERFSGFFDLSYAATDWFTFSTSWGVELNARPDHYLHAYRVGTGFRVGLDFSVEEHFFTFSISNKITPVWGVGEGEAKNCLLLNDFFFHLRYNFSNYLHQESNFGIFSTAIATTENYFSDYTDSTQGLHKGTPLFLDVDFFAGFVYTPKSFVEMSLAFALFNTVVNDIKTLPEDRIFSTETELGIRTSVDFFINGIAFGLGYRPHLGSIESGWKPSHVIDATISLSL